MHGFFSYFKNEKKKGKDFFMGQKNRNAYMWNNQGSRNKIGY